MRKFTLRVATPNDEDAVGALLEASYPLLMARSYETAMLRDALAVMTRANPALLSSGTYYVAESRQRALVGCGGWTRERPGTGESETGLAHIRHVAVHPSWTRKAVGRSIYARCEEQARAAGVRRFECHASLNAEDFYLALGFRVTRRIDVEFGSSITLPGLLMERSI